MRRSGKLWRDRGVLGRRSWRGVLLLAGATLALSACAPAGPPEVTFYSDGHTVNAKPLVNCDALVRDCSKDPNAAVNLKVRPGKPVQVSVPVEVSDTPWLVITQFTDANGALQAKQQYFPRNSKLAYTATPDAPADQIVVVEVQQLGAAFAADASGNPILDESGNPQLVARAYWSLQVQPG
ncbi:DUF2771 family protein [Amycolatopsis taiwanensis]|uniref:DUF2771 domain-containing protein n=1 Tax=Amycolatopsis taiwanensis TaxID=342230 RepID=A0A9W6VHY4_9PSEU|nr:DUF2771 family protein [Amycolatopsis taiwanensis]GLY69170.1 hypothetical protein Atai01_57890 [Amycolatopsis taiwanensis]